MSAHLWLSDLWVFLPLRGWKTERRFAPLLFVRQILYICFYLKLTTVIVKPIILCRYHKYNWRTKRSGAKRRSVFLPRSGRKTWVSLYIWLTMLPKDLLFFCFYLVRAQNFFSRTPCEKTVQDRNKRFSQKRRWWVVDEHIINTFFEKKFWTLQKLPKVLKYAFFKILERRLRKWWQLETSRLRRK